MTPSHSDPLQPVQLRGVPLTPSPETKPEDRASRTSSPELRRAEAAGFGSTEGVPRVGREGRKIHRRVCSFPGLLRILLPEQTFVPQVFAVRVVDLSPAGARLETLQMTRDMYLLVNKEPRFVRLEILVPSREKISVSGKLVWMEQEPSLCIMGISILPRREDLAEAALPSWSPPSSNDSRYLPPPRLDTYPSTTGKPRFRFAGMAFDAELIRVEGQTERTEAPVDDNHFEIEVPLVPDRPNSLTFFAVSGDIISPATPVLIVHRSNHHDTQTFRVGGLFDDILVKGNGRTLSVKFHGPPGDFLLAMKRLEDILGYAESLEFRIEMTGDAEKAAQTLKKGGKFPFQPKEIL